MEKRHINTPIPIYGYSENIGSCKAVVKNFNIADTVYLKRSRRARIASERSDYNKMSGFLDKTTFNQFDHKITDKLSDIRIDTEKLNKIEGKTHQIQQDVSTAQTDIKKHANKY